MLFDKNKANLPRICVKTLQSKPTKLTLTTTATVNDVSAANKTSAWSGGGPPAQAHEAVSGSPNSSWASANLVKFGFLNARGNNGTREGFYMKTSLVTPSFHCFNIILLLRGNVRKKIKQFCRRKFAPCANCCFSKFTRNRLRKFFSKLLCISLFRCQKLWFNKKMGSPGYFFSY